MGEYRVEILEILKRRAAPTRHPPRHPFRGVSPLRRIRHLDRLKSDATKLFLSSEIHRLAFSFLPLLRFYPDSSPMEASWILFILHFSPLE